MCGIAGYWGSSFNAEEAGAHLRRMGQAIAHRGPDDAGTWSDQSARIGLSHRRLSIVDLSDAGHQPMTSPSGRYVIVFNGEIYNHLALRVELQKLGAAPPAWRGHSDTETLLAAFERWGFEATLKKTVGMFAIALWDRERRTLALARDRMGEKPLYFGYAKGVLLFGSELAALRVHPAFEAEVNREALALMLRYNHVPAPHSIYSGIAKLKPGCWLELDEADLQQQRLPEPVAYWSLQEVIAQGRANPFTGSETEATDALEQTLREAIGLQMVADVPLGAFLSGGVDSSAVVALMQAQSTRPVKTFTIGFHEKGYNEAEHAKQVARHLGTDHTELYVTPQQALDVIPRLPALYSEPFADSSQIPTHLVSALARQHVTVSLSGDGGDELFGGYNRYLATGKAWQCATGWPMLVRQLVANALSMPSPQAWDAVYSAVERLVPASKRISQPGDKIHKLSSLLTANSPQDMYQRLISQWKNPLQAVHGANEPQTLLTNRQAWPPTADFENWMMAQDSLSYLPDDILVKVDRAAMGVSLESRVPMLDHRVVELAWRMPLSMKICNGQGKWLLRQVLDRHVPRELIERPKAGFAVPIDHWMRGPLCDWAESLLSDARLRKDGYFNPAPIRKLWTQLLAGNGFAQHQIWCVLMFQAWQEKAKSDRIERRLG